MPPSKVGIIAGIGDRRQEDNEGIGKIAAEMFVMKPLLARQHLRGKNRPGNYRYADCRNKETRPQ